MRSLTNEERQLLEKRECAFPKFLQERMPVLSEFMDLIELPEAPMVLVDAQRFVVPLDQWLKTQNIKPEDRIWTQTRLGYFVGEYLIQHLSGCWYLNDVPDSRFFARYVVGKFHRIANPNAMVDPFDIVGTLLDQSIGRRLTTF